MMTTHIAAGSASSLRCTHRARLRHRPVDEFRSIDFKGCSCRRKQGLKKQAEFAPVQTLLPRAKTRRPPGAVYPFRGKDLPDLE